MNNEWLAFREREKELEEPYTYRQCIHCEGEVNEVFAGDEGLSVCQDCGIIEGGDIEAEEVL